MDKKMEEYLKNLALPEYESPEHQQELRHKLLDEMKRRNQMASRKRTLRIIYVLAALVCISAIAIAGVKYRKWRFEGKEDGADVFAADDGAKHSVSSTVVTTKIAADGKTQVVSSSPDPDFTIDVEQKKKDLEEMDILSQQGKREVVKVIKTEVEDESFEVYIYKYVLADGREETVADSPPGRIPEKGSSVDINEVYKLRMTGKGELLEPEEREVEGRVFTFERQKVTLSDGREVIHSIGTPKEETEAE
jgi:hypothetical protein